MLYKFKFYDQDENGKYNDGDYIFGRGTGHLLRTKYNFGFDYMDFDQNGKFSLYNQKEINSSKITWISNSSKNKKFFILKLFNIYRQIF